MRLLAFGDTHVKPTGESPDYDRLGLPAGTDAVVTVGDVVHRTGREDLRAGRDLLGELADLGVPVYTVPGNHDPAGEHGAMVEGVSGASVLHDEVVSVGDVDLLGWGCEEFDAGPEVTCRDYSALDPRTSSGDRRHAADRNARRLETATYEFVTTDATERDVADKLGITRDERPTLAEQLAELRETYDRLDALFEEASSPTVVLSHVPPYGTELDRHHSLGEREADLDDLHVGSLALKLALRVHRPAVGLSGHSHNPVYETLQEEGETVHLLNLGYQGVATVDYDEGFSYARHGE
ncbi:metallophosphoesterase family protein [Halorussus lipolyticus]|uniref:metallophosphoesterase family protein n=1 Tax=Halorussus lipolyticus TaxID=3034024 RepID=UPI0023E7F6CC|nr:metallophosphoesterase [Halorussus sp. DT80]